MRPRIAITPGDPRGIGPEVALAAVKALATEGLAFDPILMGPDRSHLVPESASLSPSDWVSSTSLDDPSAGRIAVEAIEHAVEMALAGEVEAVVTAPIHKPSLHAAGRKLPGHTELLQELTGAEDVGMLMAAEKTRLGAPLRVLLATTHIALSEVPARLTADLLVAQTTLLVESLRNDWSITEPRVALCALNPHASDGGLFGDEEARIYAPALERLEQAGIRANGPFPADTVFQRALAGHFHAVVAPYHDVGMAAFKTVCFGTGVNVTLGLPFVRTSPDHGTAFDLAGTGKADPSSMIEALRLAIRLARSRFDRGPLGA
ncbi:MAG: 4-hydroxythreonine-4-phosphate dehydrogenase PdxA [Gemmatimonadota bacterium]